MKLALSSHSHTGFYNARRATLCCTTSLQVAKFRAKNGVGEMKENSPRVPARPTLGPAEQEGAPPLPTYKGSSSFHPQP